MARQARLEIVKNAKGRQRWWYRLKGGNGEIFWNSEKFSSRSKCIARVTRMRNVLAGVGEITDTTQ